MLDLETLLGRIRDAQCMDELVQLMQQTIEGLGFESFNHLDTGRPDSPSVFYQGTCPEDWQRCYRDNGFVDGDPMVATARRRRLPFSWADVQMPDRGPGPKPLAWKIMEAATDHGYREGYIVPSHTVDLLGRPRSALTALFWKESKPEYAALMSEQRHLLHVFLIYWQERAIDFVWRDPNKGFRNLDGEGLPFGEIRLTDRERDVMSWVARGKTTQAIAMILNVATVTVETHIRSAMSKLGASNRTAAAVRAVQLQLIDV